MPIRPNDPYMNFNFTVEIEGIEAAGFLEVSGIVAETAVVEYREGNMPGQSLKLPGQTRFGNVTLKRGISRSTALWNWYKSVIDGDADRRNVSIILLNTRREEVRRWNLFEAWPCKFEAAPLNAKGNDVVIETLEIVAERIELA